MRKNIYFILVLLFSVTCVDAQIKLQPFLSVGSQSIDYSYDNASLAGGGGLGFGANALYYLNQNMVVGAGVKMVKDKATASLVDYTSDLIDADGDSYELEVILSDVEEEHSLSTVEIPLFFRYQDWLSEKVLWYGSTGPVFVLPGSMKSEFTSGALSTSGYYDEWHLTIDDVEEYGFYKRDLVGESPEVDTKVSVAWSFEVGAEYLINKRLNLFVAACYQQGLSNVADGSGDDALISDSYTFNSSLSASDGIKLKSMGIKFGVTIDLTPPDKAGVKSIR